MASQSNVQSFPQGTIIFYEGDLGEEMYIIKSGRVEIVREMGDSQLSLAELGQSEFFGEMSLFGEPKRAATARAIENTELLVITKQMLNAQFRRVPEWLVTMIKTIAQRILSTNRGVKANFPVSMEYSILRAIQLMEVEFGTPKEKGVELNLQLVREEICNVLGIEYVDIDGWLKKINFANLVKVLSSKNLLFVPDSDRLSKFIVYLDYKKNNSPELDSEFDSNAQHAMERIMKLLCR